MSTTDLRTFYQRYIDMLNAHELHRVDEFINDELTHYGQAVTRDQAFAALTGRSTRCRTSTGSFRTSRSTATISLPA
ncbi:hypothetical protein ACFXKS_37520 [Streptomyces scopuliridis]|uniref:hypothetical protein n=1 Tax=Streptomyces scopuliridis TaxID=452529 RepID=UPI0036C0E1E3